MVCHYFSYEMVAVAICHYKSSLVMNFECHYNTYTFSDATFGDVQFLVMEAMVHHHCSYAVVTITIHHYKSLLVTNFECHYNTYTFGSATIDHV